ncbi:alpha-amylase, partial [gut metagenome]
SLGLVINMGKRKCLTIRDFQLLNRKAEELEADGNYGYHLTMGLDGMQTLALPYPTLVPSGVKAFAATAVKNQQIVLSEIEEGIVPAHTGVIIEAAAGDYHFKPSAEAGRTQSLLLGVTESAATDNALKYYTLTLSPKPGFTLYEGLELEKNRAYFTRPASESLTFFPFQLLYVGMDNGALSQPHHPAPTYDLSGRRVKNPGRGVYITEGKKVWIQ